MNRRLSILLALTSALLWAVLVSACKPESRSQVLQPTNTVSVQTTSAATTNASVAPTVAVTSTLNKLPVCQFSNTVIPPLNETLVPNLNAYVFSSPTIVLTSPASSAAVAILQWLPDSTRLLVVKGKSKEPRQTIETFDTITQQWQVYATQNHGTRAFWVPQKQAVVYEEQVSVDPQNGVWRTELWASGGIPDHSVQIAEDASTVLIDDSQGWVVRQPAADTSPSAANKLSDLLPTYSLPPDPREWLNSHEPASNKNWERVWSAAVDSVGTQAVFFQDLSLILIDKGGQVCKVPLNIKSANRIIGAKWSPNGRFVAIRGTAEDVSRSFSQPLYILDTSSGKLLEPNTGMRFVERAGWLPDGRHLMAIGYSKTDTIGFPVAQMILIDALSGEVRNVFDNGEWGQIPVTTQWALSPDGRKIAIACPTTSTQGHWQLVASRICLVTIEPHAQ